ncbi:hypothetical protein CRG98_003022 [Punica granatum]|uniref:Uncharacterized protein n=1 Tax=Punica granatum TaxID=22663 RepID=A0A2I0L7F1_PUNGR|nr:hypothetical protein CRG98_003022 [Punica granatum]
MIDKGSFAFLGSPHYCDQLHDPDINILYDGKYLMIVIQELVSGNKHQGRLAFGCKSKRPRDSADRDKFTKDGTNPKSLLQTLLRAFSTQKQNQAP